jgi:hypothetical protein
MGQIDISMLEKLARHWSIQKTGKIEVNPFFWTENRAD